MEDVRIQSFVKTPVFSAQARHDDMSTKKTIKLMVFFVDISLFDRSVNYIPGSVVLQGLP
jgi:hypothetical protein